MTVATRLYTAEDLLRMPANGQRTELVAGELREMAPAGGPHGSVAMRLGSRLGPYVEEHGLGEVFAAETGFKIRSNPDTVRAPDVAFVRKDRIEAIGIPRGYWPGAPDLLVEVLSPDDRPSDVDAKIRDWLSTGCRVAIVIDPESRSASIHRSTGVVLIGEDDTIEADDVIPGWRVKLADLFRPGKT